ALDAADDPVADGERAEQAAARARRVRSTVDHDDRVHALAGDAHPAAAHAHLRRVDRRAVEVARGDAGLRDGFEARVAVLLGDAGRLAPGCVSWSTRHFAAPPARINSVSGHTTVWKPQPARRSWRAGLAKFVT